MGAKIRIRKRTPHGDTPCYTGHYNGYSVTARGSEEAGFSVILLHDKDNPNNDYSVGGAHRFDLDLGPRSEEQLAGNLAGILEVALGLLPRSPWI